MKESAHPTFTRGELETYGHTLSRMIRCKTVSRKDSYDDREFSRLRSVMEGSFPTVHAKAKRMIFAEDCWMYKIPGKDPARNILLMSHHDVVDAKQEDGWGPIPPLMGRSTRAKSGAVVPRTPRDLFAPFSSAWRKCSGKALRLP